MLERMELSEMINREPTFGSRIRSISYLAEFPALAALVAQAECGHWFVRTSRLHLSSGKAERIGKNEGIINDRT